MEPDFGPAPAGGTQAPLVRRLGAIPFWRGEQRFLEAMGQCGDRSAAAGLRIWAGDPPVRDTVPRPSVPAFVRAGRARPLWPDQI